MTQGTPHQLLQIQFVGTLALLFGFPKNKRTDAFLEKLRAPMRQKLVEAHEESKKAVRDHQKKIDALQKRIAEAQAELNTKKDAVARAMTSFRAATENRKQLSRYATRAAIAEADAAVQKAERSVDRANAAQTDLQQLINQMVLVEREPLMKERDKLMAEELELDAAINGKSFTNSLGILIPARPPLF
jgi:chromosome segregation ATPase